MSSVKKSMSKIQVGLKLKLTLWFMLIMAIVSSCLVGVVVGISENVVIKEQEKELVSSVVGFKQNVEAFGMTNKEIPSHLLFNKGMKSQITCLYHFAKVRFFHPSANSFTKKKFIAEKLYKISSKSGDL